MRGSWVTNWEDSTLKSSSNKTAAALVPVLVLAGVLSPTLHAGVSKLAGTGALAEQIESTDKVKLQPNGRELPTSAAKSKQNRPNSVFQCWQEGNLLLDERDWKLQGSTMSSVDFSSDSGRFAKLKLIRVGDTFCTLKYDVR